jgi:hypothetical protein
MTDPPHNVHCTDMLCFSLPKWMDPNNLELNDVICGYVTRKATHAVLDKYVHGDLPVPMIERIDTEWMITDDPTKVPTFHPGDDPRVHAGKDQTLAYLAQFPGQYIAMGWISYTEVWARSV